MKGTQQGRISAIGTILLAIVVGCVSEPAIQPQTLPAATTPSAKKPVTSSATTPSTATTTETAETTDRKIQPQLTDTRSSDVAGMPADSVVAKNKADEDIFVNGKKLSLPKITGSVPPRDDAYHDTDNNAIVVLQSPTKAMANFPRDRRNEVDWVKTLDQGYIEPRADLKGESEMVTMDMDILMKNTQFMPWVRFPHIAHTKWLACENCHPRIFIPQENANPISMNKVLRGEYCGVCHDKVAFSLFICERCHSVPHEGSGPAWWK